MSSAARSRKLSGLIRPSSSGCSPQCGWRGTFHSRVSSTRAAAPARRERLTTSPTRSVERLRRNMVGKGSAVGIHLGGRGRIRCAGRRQQRDAVAHPAIRELPKHLSRRRSQQGVLALSVWRSRPERLFDPARHRLPAQRAVPAPGLPAAHCRAHRVHASGSLWPARRTGSRQSRLTAINCRWIANTLSCVMPSQY